MAEVTAASEVVEVSVETTGGDADDVNTTQNGTTNAEASGISKRDVPSEANDITDTAMGKVQVCGCACVGGCRAKVSSAVGVID